MNVFDLRDRLDGDYARHTRSVIKIADTRISEKIDSELNAGAFWPESLLQLNPTFLPGGTIDELAADGKLHPECSRIFRIDKSDTDHTGKQLLLHMHQKEAILKAKEGKSYVLTSGTGSAHMLGLLVHDSPREADLGIKIYRNFIRFVASLQEHFSAPGSCPFQHAVTTTTPPPHELNKDQFVKLRLNAARTHDLLLRMNITTAQQRNIPLFT